MGCNRLFYHGDLEKYRRRFFEGWYFKHKNGDQVFAVIPGMSADDGGRRKAFIQIIYNGGSLWFEYDFTEFYADSQRLYVKIAGNEFSAAGLHLDIERDGHRIQADLEYGRFSGLRTNLYSPDIMGPFSYASFLECYHGVISLRHYVNGHVEIDGEVIDFTGLNASGYIEKDWGRSFPQWWFWTSFQGPEGNEGQGGMLAAARIPFMGMHFTGVIGAFLYDGKQLRIGTYYGAKLISREINDKEAKISVEQNQYRVDMRLDLQDGGSLLAPVLGSMDRSIVEYPACRAEAAVYKGGKPLIYTVSDNASCEFVEG